MLPRSLTDHLRTQEMAEIKRLQIMETEMAKRKQVEDRERAKREKKYREDLEASRNAQLAAIRIRKDTIMKDIEDNIGTCTNSLPH